MEVTCPRSQLVSRGLGTGSRHASPHPPVYIARKPLEGGHKLRGLIGTLRLFLRPLAGELALAQLGHG